MIWEEGQGEIHWLPTSVETSGQANNNQCFKRLNKIKTQGNFNRGNLRNQSEIY